MTMAYQKEHAICILLDGKVVPEKDGAVILPFGSEYKVRLKNKSRVRSVADVYIDGEVAAKGIVLNADVTIDLERFVKDLNQGPKFKLARLSNPAVAQPGDSQNGLLEVRFYKEKVKPQEITKIVEHHTYDHHHNSWGHCRGCCGLLYCSTCHPYNYHWHNHPWVTLCSDGGLGQGFSGGGTTSGMQAEGAPGGVYNASGDSINLDSSAFLNSTSLTPPVTLTSNACLRSASFEQSAPEAAATIGGSSSNQAFTPVNVEIDESTMVSLSLILKGVGQVYSVCTCGRKRQNEKFCPDCGKMLVSE